MSGLDLIVLEGEVALVRLDAGAAAPDWARAGTAGVLGVTATPSETSIVCDPAAVPGGVPISRGWRVLVVDGTLEHSLTGVLASIAAPLAAASVPIFAVSTFDTDYVLVPGEHLGAAVEALRGSGHGVAAPAPAD